jgi:hypothetical protein
LLDTNSLKAAFSEETSRFLIQILTRFVAIGIPNIKIRTASVVVPNADTTPAHILGKKLQR